MLVEAERDVELGDPLLRDERREERDELARALDLDVEVGAREAEDDRDVLGGEEDGIQDDAALAVDEREHERRREPAAPQPADEVGPLPAVEDRLHHLDGLDGLAVVELAQVRVELDRGDAHVALLILVRHGERERAEDGPEERLRRHLAAIARVHRDRPLPDRRPVRGEELDRRVDADRHEHAARDRVEERLGDLAIRPGLDARLVQLLHGAPERVIVRRAAELRAHRPHAGVHEPIAQVEPLARVGLAGGPVLRLEPPARTAGDPGPLVPVRLEARRDRAGARRGDVVRIRHPWTVTDAPGSRAAPLGFRRGRRSYSGGRVPSP